MSVKLVAIGDSLTQGFKSGCICETNLSYPSIIARCLGLEQDEFRIPNFKGSGGLPLNIEQLLNTLVQRYGDRLDWLEFIPKLLTINSYLDQVEDYWERGEGNQADHTGPLHHNLAVWGFQLGDAQKISHDVIATMLMSSRDNIKSQIPEAAQYRTARRVLNPSYDRRYGHLTQIRTAQKIAEQEGKIENLIFWLGSNNCLPSIIRLDIKESNDQEINLLPHQRQATLWRSQDFQTVLDQVCQELAKIPVDNVFIANVPHVTIPPISRGVTPDTVPGQVQDQDGYFAYYTHFWIWDQQFSPQRHPHLVREQVRYLDETVDKYNEMIKQVVLEKNWHLVDICSLLDSLAFRRLQGQPPYQFPPELVTALTNNPLTANRVINGTPLIDSRYIHINPNSPDPQQRYEGGLFSLDGIHCTTTGYGIVAHEFLQVMQQAGVDHQPIDWDWVIANDSLLTHPPQNLAHLRDILGFLYSQTPLPKILRMIGGINFN